MVGAEHVPVVVEKRLRSCRQIDRAEHDAHGAGIDALEIDRLGDQFAQFEDRDDRFCPREPSVAAQ